VDLPRSSSAWRCSSKGLDAAIFPAGETMAFDFARRGSFLWLMAFAFCISFASVAAEPALMAVAYKAEAVSGGSMGATDPAHGGGARRRPGGHGRRLAHRPRPSDRLYLIPGYLIVVGLTALSPPELVGLAFDSGGVVASTVTAPLLTAMGVGLAATIRGRNPMLDGFGLIAFGALAPMIIIQLYGILFFVPASRHRSVDLMPSDDQHHFGPVEMLLSFPEHGQEPLADHRRGPVLELSSFCGGRLPTPRVWRSACSSSPSACTCSTKACKSASSRSATR
jgi:hypothetical protein